MSFIKHNSSLNIVLLHKFFFFNMFQSLPKDFSYMGLLLHSPSQRFQATMLALLANTSSIARLSLSHWSRKDLRVIQWSNDVLSTLLDLYEEKYLASGCGSFRIKNWKDIWKNLMTHILTKNANVVTLTLGLWLNVKSKGPWGLKCLVVKKTLTNGGKMQGMKPNDS